MARGSRRRRSGGGGGSGRGPAPARGRPGAHVAASAAMRRGWRVPSGQGTPLGSRARAGPSRRPRPAPRRAEKPPRSRAPPAAGTFPGPPQPRRRRRPREPRPGGSRAALAQPLQTPEPGPHRGRPARAWHRSGVEREPCQMPLSGACDAAGKTPRDPRSQNSFESGLCCKNA
ncbi:translation initiation factor IF-2-like [Phacochoerus africanus]|uniref:translation initiation factor IF-2-like n=1 Tax=Phacochoerus africanus TaxID=41426 RepID=UPI001FD9FBC6|nr:translation initiation factor IF-2-like [Phacochoerus africanus]